MLAWVSEWSNLFSVALCKDDLAAQLKFFDAVSRFF